MACKQRRPQGFTTSVPAYAVSLTPEYVLKPLLSSGDRVPHTADAARQFQMIGVPDGLGAYKLGGRGAVVLMNHELAGTATSEPVVGAPLYRGAFVSEIVLDRDANVISGQVAYDVVVDTELGVELPPAQVGNTTHAFWRFCSATLGYKDVGFDRPIYLIGEENPSPNTFDGRGGLAVAIVDGKLHTLPHLGRFQHENLPIQPDSGDQTVLVLMEDNGTGYDSQIYLYVGEKNEKARRDALARNGLTGGKFYVFVATTPGVQNESQFQSGSITGKWVELTGVAAMTEAQLEAASDAVGAFGMTKSEDGAWSKREKNEFFFNSTGDGLNAPSVAANHFGRTYRLQLNRRNVTGPATLSIIYNADLVIAAGGDIALTPDNIDTSEDYLMVCEDGTGFSRNLMAGLGRTGLIWRYDLNNNYAAEPIVSLLTSGRDGVPVGAGIWETSGILNTEKIFGRNSWIFDVQAHPPTAAPLPGTVEDGQLVLMLPAGGHGDE